MPKIIAEFVDARNGKRYGPGDEDKVDPDLTSEQVERLVAAQCIDLDAPTTPKEMTAGEAERPAPAADPATHKRATHARPRRK